MFSSDMRLRPTVLSSGSLSQEVRQASAPSRPGSPKSLEQRQALFASQRQLAPASTSSPLDPHAEAHLRVSIESAPSASIAQKVSQVPRPVGMDKVLAQLAEGGIAQAEARSERLQPAHPGLVALAQKDQERLNEASKQFREASAADKQQLANTVPAKHEVALAAEFDAGSLTLHARGGPKPNFGAILRGNPQLVQIERALRPTVMFDTTIQTLVSQAQTQAEHMASTASPKGPFLAHVMMTPPDQLREELARAVGGMRPDRYGPDVTYASLSPEKQAVVDALIAGFTKGLESQSYEVSQAVGQRMADDLSARLEHAAPTSDLVFSVSLKGKADLLAEVGIKLGLVSHETVADYKWKAENEEPDATKRPAFAMSWTKDLRPDQQMLLHAAQTQIEQVINQTVPNKPSSEKLEIETRKGLREVPASITLNGKIYDQPKYLGQGGLGLILQYSDQITGEPVVIKSLLVADKRDDMVKELIAHRHAMGGGDGAGHPNLIGMRGVVRSEDGGLMMVMDMAKGGDLMQMTEGLSHAVKSGVLPPRAQTALVQMLARDAVAGMKHLQERNMMHMDIKGLNFLLDEHGKVMLSDFGSGQRTDHIEGEKETAGIATTVNPPELLAHNRYTTQSDIFQLGSALRHMFGGDPMNWKPTAVTAGSAGTFINAMLDPDPAKRPTLKALEASSFLKDAESQDPEKMRILLSAAVKYGQAIAKEDGRLKKEVNTADKDLLRLNQELRSLDKVAHPEQAANLHLQIQALESRIEDLSGQIARLASHPDIKPLGEELRKLSDGLA